ncbi:hypothetical protein J4E82_006732 [Alternaria postmessia]|uniref:uncharacterized protein n=1 Tax=Alternaria postmessia TaxID=1187938 RepID=UPI002224AFC9|nr:uncharacterized protein J4E82_006732 [Alternaria postmessia]KAI5374498.1 hypothetical protein J4E82_006732 [Alternaria postmessia]
MVSCHRLDMLLARQWHNVLCTSDPKTIEHVLKKWREFVKPDNVNEILGTFGQNVDTSNGDDWIRHRKLTAPCFNERASATVWSESMRQSKIMIEQWLSSSDGKWKSMIKDTSTLALNVISSVAFENTEVNKPTPGHALSLRDTLVTVMSTSISPTMEGILPFLQFPILQSLLPSDVKDLLQAMHEFRQYMNEIIVTEREAMTSGQTRVSALISTLIEASGQVKTESRASKARLSDTELRGNIFIFLVGGLESTSITLSYAIALLAVHPDIQDWVVEELDEVLSDNVNSEMEYVRVFPRLKRVMAVMEGTESTNLPANTQIMLNSWACQTSFTNFPDPITWNPKRWIQPHLSETTKKALPATLAAEELKHATGGSGFVAWGTGSRICPGMKFSQVEFCSVLSTVLKGTRVETVCGEDEEVNTARQKVMDILKDSCADPLLLHVRQPEKLELRIFKR